MAAQRQSRAAAIERRDRAYILAVLKADLQVTSVLLGHMAPGLELLALFIQFADAQVQQTIKGFLGRLSQVLSSD